MTVLPRARFHTTGLLLIVLALAACRASTPPVAPPPTAVPAATATLEIPTMAPQRSAALAEIHNLVESSAQADAAWLPAQDGTVVQEGGAVRTALESAVRLNFSEGTILRLGAETEITIEYFGPLDNDPLTRLKMGLGELWVNLLGGGKVEVTTPVGIASVRGSFLRVWVRPGTQPNEVQVLVTCLEGDCHVQPGGGSDIPLLNGQSARFSGDTSTGQAAPAQLEQLTLEQLELWLKVNPEATIVVPMVTPEIPTPTPTAQPAVEINNAPAATATTTATAAASGSTARPTASPRPPTATEPQPAATETSPPASPATNTPQPAATPTLSRTNTSPPPTQTPIPQPTDTPPVVATSNP